MRYSIIIPHKNTPQLLQRLLDSIPQRDDLEVIVVDDNSDPSIVDFCHYPGKDRPNIHLIFTTEDRGAGYARNVGMDNSRGEWIVFADADDFFVTSNLNDILNSNIPDSCDVLMWETFWKTSDTPIEGFQSTSFDGNFIPKHDAPDAFITNVAPWARMIRKSAIEKFHLRFEEQQHANDVMFTARLSFHIHDYLYTTTVVYIYDNSFSFLTKQINAKTIAQRYNTLIRSSRYAYDLLGLKTRGEQLLHIDYTRFLLYTAWGVIRMGYGKMMLAYRAACADAGYSTVPYKTKIKLFLIKWRIAKFQS
ncbi:MAG: glycosyltransferase family 2 protein [Bacteroidales bacterium]|nr:glycosyltransferase family 2 protein [Bacteroidales bacterium]